MSGLMDLGMSQQQGLPPPPISAPQLQPPPAPAPAQQPMGGQMNPGMLAGILAAMSAQQQPQTMQPQGNNQGLINALKQMRANQAPPMTGLPDPSGQALSGMQNWDPSTMGTYGQ